jgi:AcrR family transcriptional regulator
MKVMDGERSPTRSYRMGARAEAAEATRARIVEVATALFMASYYDEVTLRGIAAEAGVALQTVVNHFETKEGVFAAVMEGFREQAQVMRSQAPPGDLARAAELLVADYEQIGDATIRGLSLDGRVDVMTAALARGREVHKAWVQRTFPAAPEGLRGAERRRRLAQLLTVTDVETWKLLRRDHGLSRDQTVAAIRELLEALHP